MIHHDERRRDFFFFFFLERLRCRGVLDACCAASSRRRLRARRCRSRILFKRPWYLLYAVCLCGLYRKKRATSSAQFRLPSGSHEFFLDENPAHRMRNSIRDAFAFQRTSLTDLTTQSPSSIRGSTSSELLSSVFVKKARNRRWCTVFCTFGLYT